MQKRFLPIVSAFISIIISAWISLTPLAWVTQKDISDKYYSLITPAPFTFSIWSLIYLAWVGVSFLIATKKIKISKRENLFFSLSMFLTSLWLFPWHLDEIAISLGVILLIIASFIYLFSLSRKSEKIFRYTVDLSLWWIFIATIANTTVFLVSKGVNIGLTWVFMALWVLAFVNGIIVKKYKNFIPSFVFLWASLGIYIEQENMILKKTIISLAFIFILFLVKEFFIKDEKKKNKLI